MAAATLLLLLLVVVVVWRIEESLIAATSCFRFCLPRLTLLLAFSTSFERRFMRLNFDILAVQRGAERGRGEGRVVAGSV